jgi:hypothetical protein
MTAVDDFYANLSVIVSAVESKDLGALAFAGEVGSKVLVIAAAGDFEKRLNAIIAAAYQQRSVEGHLINFVEKQALEMKFHTLFDWKAPNANKFLKLFGDAMVATVSVQLKEDPYKTQMEDFIGIVRRRNIIAHEGLAEASIDLTYAEAYAKYRSALQFLNFIQINVLKIPNPAPAAASAHP